MLPPTPTSFIGRESELAQARGLLAGTRLLTLTGSGGCGKTRLAIGLARRTPEDFPHGVYFVSLAAVRDPALVPVSIARGIGLQDARGTPLLEHLAGFLAERDVLLILDNLEQVLAARGFVADLLAATTRPRILVTSRSPLHLSWEQEFPVPPLRVPARGSAFSAASLAGCESVQLFVVRAAALLPGFTVTDENAAAIAGITERLDGLALAVELAAARVKLLPPAAILARLDHSLGLLVSDHRDVPDRQQTLRATIAWSHDLLSEAARQLLAVCSVFRGGVDLATLEAICAAALDLRVPVSVRGHFSEGRRCLGDLLGLVPDDDPERVDALNGAAWLATDQGDRASAIRLLDESIERARAAQDQVREAAGLYYRGRAKQVIGDPTGGWADIERALELQTAAGDDAGLVAALFLAGASAHFEDEFGIAMERFERCVELSAALGLPAVEARALQQLGVSRLELGDLHGAKVALAKGVRAIADIGDRFAIPVGLSALAGLAAKGGRPRAALMLAEAATAYEQVNQTYRPQKIRAELDAWLAPVREKVGTAAQKLFDEGRGLSLDQAIALGLDDKPEDPWRAGPSVNLTRREREIATLVATGLTNREIAGKLYLSVRTVEVHVDHVLTKLGFRTRTQLAAWVHEDGLAPRST